MYASLQDLIIPVNRPPTLVKNFWLIVLNSLKFADADLEEFNVEAACGKFYRDLFLPD